MWETRRNEPSYEMLLRMADYFKTTTDFLLGKTDDPRIVSQVGITPVSAGNMVTMPVYNGARAGNVGEYPDGSTIIDYIQVSKRINGKFAVVIHGDSMEPEFHEEDIAILNPDSEIINNDHVIAILEDPYFTDYRAVAKIYKETELDRYLININAIKYSPIRFDGNVKFISKIVGLNRKY